jgi:hypothetical protein
MAKKSTKSVKTIVNNTRSLIEKIGPKLGVQQKHLGGLCGYASLLLHQELEANGYKAQIVTGLWRCYFAS